MRQSTVKVCFSKIGAQLNRLVIIRQGGTIILQQRRHIATVIIAIDKIRSQLDNVVQVILHNFIIDGHHFWLLHFRCTRSGAFTHCGFGLFIFQLLITHQSTHKVCRKESVVQQDTLCKVIYGTGKILNQIEVQTSHETFLGVLLVSHHIRRMSVYQSKVKAYLFLRQRSFHIGDAQWLREQFRMVQFLNILMIMYDTLHIAQFLIISQSIHRLELDGHIPVLYTSAIIALITLVNFRIVRYYNFPIIFHILVGFLTGLPAISIGVPRRIIRNILTVATFLFVTGRNTVTLVYLHLHDFELILLGSFTVANLFTGFGTLIIAGHKVRIFCNHFGIVTDSSPVIPRLRT